MYDLFMPTAAAGTSDDRPGSIAVDSPGIDGFLDALAEAAGGQEIGLYLVGSPGLGDLSPRQSNLDLVAVSPKAMSPDQLADLVSHHHALRRNGRDAAVAYTTWDGLRRAPDQAAGSVFLGRRSVERGLLVNPMTWAILAQQPRPLLGDPRPRVSSDRRTVRDWFRSRLPDLMDHAGRPLLRRHLARAVLQSTRAAHGALTGEVLSLHAAGEVALETLSHVGQRVLTDALGYREGANTSMYWGPFERRSNAATLAGELRCRIESGCS